MLSSTNQVMLTSTDQAMFPSTNRHTLVTYPNLLCLFVFDNLEVFGRSVHPERPLVMANQVCNSPTTLVDVNICAACVDWSMSTFMWNRLIGQCQHFEVLAHLYMLLTMWSVCRGTHACVPERNSCSAASPVQMLALTNQNQAMLTSTNTNVDIDRSESSNVDIDQSNCYH